MSCVYWFRDRKYEIQEALAESRKGKYHFSKWRKNEIRELLVDICTFKLLTYFLGPEKGLTYFLESIQ